MANDQEAARAARNEKPMETVEKHRKREPDQPVRLFLPCRTGLSPSVGAPETVMTTKRAKKQAIAVDLFCGAGGLTRGLLNAGIQVVAGYDIDAASKFPYEHNNSGVKFFRKSVANLSGTRLASHYPQNCVRILAGCAPCTPFSKYTQGLNTTTDKKWGLLHEFGRLVKAVKPDIVSMENVPDLQRHSVFDDFLETLSAEGFYFVKGRHQQVVYCPDYGLPQHRSRLVLVASRLGAIELLPPTRLPENYMKVSDVIRDLPELIAGGVCANDPLHRTSRLSVKNLERIGSSTPGGTWRDWPKHLIAKCHQKESGKSYPAVYGRMEWNQPAPTITTQFYGFGSGRFGHPEQLRAISLREGAILQSFPADYKFVKPGGEYSVKTIGRMIGNAVPVQLAEVIGRTIIRHLKQHG